MEKFNNNSTLKEIKSILSTKNKKFLINEILTSFWKYPKLLENNPIWFFYLKQQKEKFKKEMNIKSYKPFSKQIRECSKDDNLIEVIMPSGDIQLICVKHKKVCSSIVCKQERIYSK